MFFQITVIFASVALTLAAPQQGRDAQILRFENENIGVDGYKFRFLFENVKK